MDGPTRLHPVMSQVVCPLTPGQRHEDGQRHLQQHQDDPRAAPGSDLQDDRRHDEELTGEEEEDSRSWTSVQTGPTETDRDRPEDTRPEEETPGGQRR